MSEHGTNARYVAGCRCDDCRRAATRYMTLARLDAMHGRPRLVPALGSQRRLRALAAIGYPARMLDDLNGGPSGWTSQIMLRKWVRATTRDQVTALYDRLGMTPGPSRLSAMRAAAKGWPPPLAWDDETIDDPAATPWTDSTPRGAHVSGHGVVNRDSLTDCAEWGLTVSEAADRLGVSRDAIEHGITRHAPELRARFARNLAAKGAAA